MYFNKDGVISSLNCKALKIVDQFIYLGSNILSTESNVNIYIDKAWTAIGRLMIWWKSDLSDKIKWGFIQAVTMSELTYNCTAWTLTEMFGEKPWYETAQGWCMLF